MKKTALYIDLAFCLLVLPLMMLSFPVERWFHHFTWYVVSVATWLYLVYFINRRYTVPTLFRGRNARLFSISLIVVTVVVTYAFSSVTLYTPKPSAFDIGFTPRLPHAQQYQQAVWSLFLIVQAFSFAIGLLVETHKQRAWRQEVELERDKAQIALYKAQIKPHFLFNTLNSLYGLFLTGNAKALPSLEHFITMVRYVHTTSMLDMVALAREAEYIEQYVRLQSLRLNGKTTVDLDICIGDPDTPVPPMLLVTFVENCFKYGVSPVEACVIHISLHESDGILTFHTENRIFISRQESDRESTGVENCKKRLELLFPGRHRLCVTDDGTTYTVKLSIDLT